MAQTQLRSPAQCSGRTGFPGPEKEHTWGSAYAVHVSGMSASPLPPLFICGSPILFQASSYLSNPEGSLPDPSDYAKPPFSPPPRPRGHSCMRMRMRPTELRSPAGGQWQACSRCYILAEYSGDWVMGYVAWKRKTFSLLREKDLSRRGYSEPLLVH